MKKLYSLLIAFTLLGTFPGNLYAVLPNSTSLPSAATELKSATSASDKQRVADKKITEKTNTQVENLKAKAEKEINRRITALNNLITKVGALKKLNSDQKASLITQVQAEIANLTALKTKIESDTDLPTLKIDVQSIVASYRVYALFLPKINILAVSDEILNISDKLSSISAKLSTQIQETQTSGKDAASISATLSSLQNKISDAKTKAQNAQNLIMPLLPGGYPDNKTALQSARTTLSSARHDLNSARTDAVLIIRELKRTILN